MSCVACGHRSTSQSALPARDETVSPRPPVPVEEAGGSAADAANVIRAYYRAINEQRYADAYTLWAGNGAASGKTAGAFSAGFAGTASVDVALGTPGPIGGAAGSRYVEVPVTIAALTKDGGRRAFAGTYTLRRSVVDGATAEQREWRIHSAQIRRVG